MKDLEFVALVFIEIEQKQVDEETSDNLKRCVLSAHPKILEEGFEALEWYITAFKRELKKGRLCTWLMDNS